MYVPGTYTAWGLLAFFAWTDTPAPFGIYLRPDVYHLASLLAHAATVLVVFVILRRLCGRDWAAWAGAALYAARLSGTPLSAPAIGALERSLSLR